MHAPRILLATAILLASCAHVVERAGGPETPIPRAVVSSTASSVPVSVIPEVDATTDVLVAPKGDVTIQAFGTEAWVALTEEALLGEGDGITTGAASSATVTFSDGSIARLNANTTLYLAAIGTEEAQDVSLRLVSGEVWSKVQGILPNGGYSVQTESTLALVRGTEFGVEVESDGTVDVATYESVVEVATIEPADEGDEPIISVQGTVTGGQRMRVTKTDLTALAKQRAQLRASGKARDAAILGIRPGAIPADRLSRSFLSEGRALPLKKLELSPEEREKLRSRIQNRVGSEIPTIARERIASLVKGGLLKPTDVARLVPLVQKDLAGFLKDPRAFLRANGLLVIPVLPGVATVASVSTLPVRTESQTSTVTIDWSRIKGALLAARDKPVDPDSQRRVLEIALSDGQREVFKQKNLLSPLFALKTATTAKNYDRMHELAGAILEAL